MSTPPGASARMQFAGSLGDTLAGRVEFPAGEVRAFALFAHCFTCGKDSVAATRVARALTDAGIAVLRFDFTGLGQSAGEFADTTFSSNVGDLVAAADYLRETQEAPSLLIGHSLGGAAVLTAAHQIPEVRAIATIGAPADPTHVLRLLEEHIPEIEYAGVAWVDLGGRPFAVRSEFLRDIEEHRLLDRVRRLEHALLVMHSPTDRIVPVENARQIFDAAPHPKSFIALDGADHLLSNRQDAEFAAAMIGAWASRYLPDRDSALQTTPRAASSSPAEGIVRVSESGRGPYGQLVTTAHHRLTADEPEPIGVDSGPSPYEYLLAALGSCTSMTLRMYAQRKDWSVGRIAVTLSHSRVHADDCASCEGGSGFVDHVERTITIDGPLADEQRGALLAIADKCPVHRTLKGSVIVSTTLAPTVRADT
ncbi:MAG TPA: osmotically inducible protein C [Microbacterium sp.]|nr:osmotically inducible protein C [Microbacterium sp.]